MKNLDIDKKLAKIFFQGFHLAQTSQTALLNRVNVYLSVDHLSFPAKFAHLSGAYTEILQLLV